MKEETSINMKVLHAPYNISGQASMIAKAQRELGIESDVLVFDQNYIDYYCDINLSLSGKSIIIKNYLMMINFVKCFFKYDIFHFHFGFSLLPNNYDLPILKLFGKKTLMHYWGSDIRQSDIAIKYVHFKTLEELQKVYPAKDDDYKRKNEKIKIVHAPTAREKKGTNYVIAVIERLKQEKYNIDFILVEHKTHDEALEIYKKCDIIIDQIVLESHGTLAMEGMALGKPVLCRIDEEFVKDYQDIPLVRTDPDNIYKNLKLLIENPDMRKSLGEKGRKYVEDVHDSKKIAEQLIKLYKSI